MAKNYYKEIDKALKSYEEGRSWHEHPLDWISDRIDWAWKFRKITEDQMDELVNRIIRIFERPV